MKTDELFAGHVVGHDKPEDYISWAVQQMVDGIESKSLPILASMDFERPIDGYEVRELFRKVIDEIGTPWPDKDEAYGIYCEKICEKIISGTIPPRLALADLALLWPKTDYGDNLYSIWYELDDDVSLNGTSNGPIFNSELKGSDTDEFIKKVAHQCLQLSRMHLPKRFFHLAYCPSCKSIAEPHLARISAPWLPVRLYRALFHRPPTSEWRCGKCDSPSLQPMGCYEGREKFLQTTNQAL